MSDISGHGHLQERHAQDDFGAAAIALVAASQSSVGDISSVSNGINDILRKEYAEEVRKGQIDTLKLELDIQRQGLDFIRNMIMGPQAPDMIDHVLHSIGSNEYFDIVGRKIREHAGHLLGPVAGSTIPAWGSGAPISGMDTPSKHAAIQPTIVVSAKTLQSAVMILTHTAAGAPRHRQLLVSQQDAILAPLLQLLSHQDAQVRCSVVHCIINLTWIESRDEEGARQRASELARHGFLKKLDEMSADPNVDVKERVSTARDHLRTSLEPSHLQHMTGHELDLGSRRVR